MEKTIMKAKPFLAVMIINIAGVVALTTINKSIWFGTYERKIPFKSKENQ